MTNTLSKPNIISGRRNFLKGAAALGGSAAMLAAIHAYPVVTHTH